MTRIPDRFQSIPRRIPAIVLLLLVTTPVAAAQISGYSTTVHVTDQNKHTTPTENEITFLHYDFAFDGNAPIPNSPLENERVATAWLLLNVDHQYHNGQTFIYHASDENEIVYKVLFNGMTIEYRTHLTVEDKGWDIKNIITNGGAGRGLVVVEYKVYNETGQLVADERDEETIGNLRLGSIPDSRLWIVYENSTLIVAPDFTAHGLLPRFLQERPPDSSGRVEIRNVTFESIAVEIIATKTLDKVKLAYGFGRPGATPSYTLGSLASDAATSIGGLLGNVLNSVLDFVFKFLPQGDKIIIAKEYVVLLVDAFWEIFVQDPLLLFRVVVIVAIGYGLLLWIDPVFIWLFKPVWWVAKAVWKSLVFLWNMFLTIISFVAGKIPGA